ncbi:PqiC family protein [Limimaricola litoreus]|uniref:PqiC family protein n=2 Tax=Limimaricola litoreus TaxID=2955316 RepID=A0A9X2FVL1_9RHOB|nr:PqiC family protein [Limimaricola litoreus]
MMTRILPAMALLSALAACGGPELRYAVPQVAPTEKISIAFETVELREITLPTYAALETIYVETPEGVITPAEDLLWADDPVRAATLELARALRLSTGARVASEPWPFDDFAEARVEVRVEEFLADAQGRFRVAGQYFVATRDAEGRDRAETFEIVVPIPPATGASGLAAARAAAMTQLAQTIAKTAMR